MSVITTEIFIERTNGTHNYYYDYSLSNYINRRTKIIIICPKHGQFLQYPDAHATGKGCFRCGNEKKVKHRYQHPSYLLKRQN